MRLPLLYLGFAESIAAVTVSFLTAAAAFAGRRIVAVMVAASRRVVVQIAGEEFFDRLVGRAADPRDKLDVLIR